MRARKESPLTYTAMPGPAAEPAAAAAGRPGPGRIRRVLAWLVAAASSNAEGAVYGALMIGVLLAAEDARRETYEQTIGATLPVLVLYWVTHLYTYVLGVRLRTHEPLSGRLIGRSAVHELPLVEGGITPMAVLIVAWAAGASISSGIAAAVYATAISIVALEVAAAWRVRERHTGIWLRMALSALAGLAVVAVKVVLHV